MKPKLTKLAGDCYGPDDCPAVSLTAQGTITVQGPRRDDLSAPQHEAIVEIPQELLLEAAHALETR